MSSLNLHRSFAHFLQSSLMRGPVTSMSNMAKHPKYSYGFDRRQAHR
jgi:hypothetical protein